MKLTKEEYEALVKKYNPQFRIDNVWSVCREISRAFLHDQHLTSDNFLNFIINIFKSKDSNPIFDYYHYILSNLIREDIDRDSDMLVYLKDHTDNIRDEIINKFNTHIKIFDKFYRNDKYNSVRLFISDDFKKTIDETNNCTIKNKILQNFVKKEYIVKNNINFLSINNCASTEDNFINYVPKNRLETSIMISCVDSFFTGDTPSFPTDLFDMILIGIYGKISSVFQQSFTRQTGYGLFAGFPFVYIRKTPYKITYDFSYFKRILNHEGIQKTTSITNAINLTLEHNKFITNQLNQYTVVKREQYPSPLTGLMLCKNKRVPKDNIPENINVESIIKNAIDTNKFFESLSTIVKRALINLEKLNTFEFELVKGKEISNYYFEGTYHNNPLFFNKGTDSSSNLFGSCMRYGHTRPRIDFYANHPETVSLLVLMSKNRKYIKGRAVVWYSKELDKYCVDRVYYDNENTRIKFANYIRDNDKFVTIHSGINDLVDATKICTDFAPFEINITQSEVKGFQTPYLDSISSEVYIKDDKFILAKFPTNSYRSADAILKTLRSYKNITDRVYRKQDGEFQCSLSNDYASANNLYKIVNSTGDVCYIKKKYIYKTDDGREWLAWNGSSSTLKSNSHINNNDYVIRPLFGKANKLYKNEEITYLDCDSSLPTITDRFLKKQSNFSKDCRRWDTSCNISKFRMANENFKYLRFFDEEIPIPKRDYIEKLAKLYRVEFSLIENNLIEDIITFASYKYLYISEKRRDHYFVFVADIIWNDVRKKAYDEFKNSIKDKLSKIFETDEDVTVEYSFKQEKPTFKETTKETAEESSSYKVFTNEDLEEFVNSFNQSLSPRQRGIHVNRHVSNSGIYEHYNRTAA